MLFFIIIPSVTFVYGQKPPTAKNSSKAGSPWPAYSASASKGDTSLKRQGTVSPYKKLFTDSVKKNKEEKRKPVYSEQNRISPKSRIGF